MPLDPTGDFGPSDPLIADLWKKNPAGAHICVSHKRIESNSIYSLCLGLLVTCVIVGNVFQYL